MYARIHVCKCKCKEKRDIGSDVLLIRWGNVAYYTYIHCA
jgi:hypothetical protein